MNKFDADAYDAICELINIINGAYATKLSYEEITLSLTLSSATISRLNLCPFILNVTTYIPLSALICVCNMRTY